MFGSAQIVSFFTVGLLVFFASFAHAKTKTPSYPTQFPSHGFQDVHVYFPQHKTSPKGVILFLKPASLGAEAGDVAKRLAREGRLVVVVDPKKFNLPSANDHRQCSSLSDCMIALSAYVQRHEKFKEIQNPSVLAVGESGSMAEEAWREAPLAAFNVTMTFDYCPKSIVEPQLSAEHRTLWTVVASPRGLKDCAISKSALLPLADIERASIANSPRLKSGPMIRWVNERLAKIDRENARGPSSLDNINLDDLNPVVMDPHSQKEYDSFVVLYSGDGGWAEFTDELAIGMNKLAIPVVGINSMRYFWRARTPDGGGGDLTRLIRFYAAKWKATKVHLVGFSFGAGTLPFFAKRLPDDLKKQVATLALLAPYRKADFEFTLSDWFFDDDRGADVLPEVKSMGLTVAPLCIYPTEEKSESLCTQEAGLQMTNVELPGGHHFGNDIERVVRLIFSASGTSSRPK